jgi:hypothetical protein
VPCEGQFVEKLLGGMNVKELVVGRGLIEKDLYPGLKKFG